MVMVNLQDSHSRYIAFKSFEKKLGREPVRSVMFSLQRGMAIVLILGVLITLMHLERSAQALPHQPTADSSRSTEFALMEAEIQSIIQRARDAWVNGDAEGFASLFTSDGEFLVPGNRWVGQDAIRQVAADFAAHSSNVTVVIHRIIIQNNQAAVEWHWEDTDASGHRNQADDVIVIDFVDRRIHRWREYIDTQTPQGD